MQGSIDDMIAAFEERIDKLEGSGSEITSATNLQNVNASSGSVLDMIDAFEQRITELGGNIDSCTNIEAAEDIDDPDSAEVNYVDVVIEHTDDELNSLDIFNSWSWDKQDDAMVLTTVSGQNVHEYNIPYEDLSFDMDSIHEDIENIMKAVTGQNDASVESATEIYGHDDEVYKDENGMFGDPGEYVTYNDAKDYWNACHESDPCLTPYSSFEEWWADTFSSLTPVSQ